MVGGLWHVVFVEYFSHLRLTLTAGGGNSTSRLGCTVSRFALLLQYSRNLHEAKKSSHQGREKLFITDFRREDA